jgi:glutamate-ammonia-ligase adenylyltransferase
LQKQPGKVSGEQFAEERRSVMRLWHELGLS